MNIRIFLVLLIVNGSTQLYAQTNTFPTSGNVGIGTTTPQGLLHISNTSGPSSWMVIEKGSGAESGLQFRKLGSVQFYLYSDNATNDALKIQSTAVTGENDDFPRIQIPFDSKDIHFALSGGNVSIGGTAPVAKLDVVGPSTGGGVTLRVGGGGDFMLNPGGSVFFDGNYSYGTGNYIRPIASNTQAFFTSGVERLRITSTGGIGVGTSAPYAGSRLHAKSPGATHWGIVVEASASDRITGVGHDGTAGFISTSFLDNGGWSPLILRTSNTSRMFIGVDGKVGIGTNSPDELFTVNGKIHAKEVKVNVNVPGPDYVFESDYELMSLQEVAKYIETNKHLPEVPSAKQIEENGINVSDMNMILLKKVEELTLHLIEKDKEIQLMKSQILELQKK